MGEPSESDSPAQTGNPARTAAADGTYALKKASTDLGLVAEDILKLALQALFAPTPSDGTSGFAQSSVLEQRAVLSDLNGRLWANYERLHAEALAVHQVPSATSITGARIVAIEMIGTHFQDIGHCALHLLRLAWAFGGDCERALPDDLRTSGRWRQALAAIVEVVRGAVLVCASGERGRARAVGRAANEAQAQSAALVTSLISALAAPTSGVTALQRLIEVATIWGEIAGHAAAICEIESTRDFASTSPPASR